MKKVIALITCLVILLGVIVIPEPIEVHAEEISYNEYYIEFLSSTGTSSAGANYYNGYYCHTNIKLQSSKKIAFYYHKNSSSIELYNYIMDSSGNVIQNNSFMVNLTKKVDSFYNCSYTKGLYKFDGGKSYNFTIISEQYDNYVSGGLNWEGSKIEDSGFISTNIPIFADESSALAYLNGTLDVSNAVNYSELQTQVYNDPDVPTPRNLEVIHDKEKNRYYIQWEQSTEDLEMLSVVGFVDTVNNFSSPQFSSILEYVDYKSQVGCTLEPALTQKIDITVSVLYFKEEAKKLGYEEYNAELYFTVMNAYFSTRTEMRYAYYVSARLIISRSEDGGFNVQFDVEETDNNFEQVEGSDYNKNTINFKDLDISDRSFFNYITSGFGMFGENGLIPMLSATFSFIPEPLWIVMASGISILFFVALFKLAMK